MTLEPYPPYQYLKTVLQHEPKAGLFYMQIWELADSNLHVSLNKKTVRETFYSSPTRVRNDIAALVREGLISLHETKVFYEIDLVGWDDED